MSGLSEEQSKRFAEMLRDKGLQSLTLRDRIPVRSSNAAVKLTPEQKQIWLFEQLNPGNTAYYIHYCISMEGNLQVDALRAAIHELVKRHEVLSTTIRIIQGEPMQVYDPTVNIEPEIVHESSSMLVPEKELIVRLSREALQVPFDLTKGALVRFRLVRIREDKHLLLLTIHHIIADGWSTGIMLQEVTQYYNALGRGLQPSLPPLRIQYADYAEWKESRTEELQKGIDYWRSHLLNAPALTALPTDAVRPQVQTYEGDLLHFSLSQALSTEIRSYCSSHNITTFMFLLAAFNALIMRYTEQEDLLLGIPLSGREEPETRQLIGMFVNTAVIRTRLHGRMTFRELAVQVRDNVLAATRHGHVPFYKLVEQLAPPRSLSHSPLFQIMFMMQDTPPSHLGMHDLEIDVLKTEYGSSQFDLSIAWREENQRLIGMIEYNTALFKPSTVQRLQKHYTILLEHICLNPDKPLANLQMLSAPEEQQIHMTHVVDQASESEVVLEPGLKPKRLIELFYEQVKRTPDRVAMLDSEDQLTYVEVADQVQRLAIDLRHQGMTIGSVVGIMLERPLDFVIASLAVLETGAAYLPLDCHAPLDRIAYMLLDSESHALITSRVLCRQELTHGRKVILVDDDRQHTAQVAIEEIDREQYQLPHSIAAIIYTSGTTGSPKGVMLEDFALVNLVESFIETYQVQPEDRLLPVTSLVSASFIGEVFPMLCAGGCLYMPEYHELLDLERLCIAVIRHRITIMSSVPSFIGYLNRHYTNFPHLRLILSGGETLHHNEIDNLVRHKAIVNSYGLTESTVCSTYHFIQPEDIANIRTLPIGKPIRNTQIYIMDRFLNCMPTGCVGEICIAGAGVSPGYLHNPSLTNERFVEHPWLAGQRLLRTGDRGRLLENGCIEYLGRADKQIKIRGFRIEAGEIESVLRQYPGVQQVSVQMLEREQQGKSIVAYLQIQSESLFASELKEWLRQRLPEYMVPSMYYTIASFPQNTNGKVDVNLLAELSKELPLSPNLVEGNKSISRLEQKLADIWKEILGLQEVQLDQNFFDLGGHSLMLAGVCSKIKQEIDRDIELIDLFKYPSIASLAAHLGRKSDHTQLQERVTQRINSQKASMKQRKMKAESRKSKGGD